MASSPCNVLVTGETGTGKELVAQAIHFSDVTRRGTLVPVTCAALPEARRSSLVAGRSCGAAGGRAGPGELDSVIGPPNLARLSLSVKI